jgi:hypothetical protein
MSPQTIARMGVVRPTAPIGRGLSTSDVAPVFFACAITCARTATAGSMALAYRRFTNTSPAAANSNSAKTTEAVLFPTKSSACELSVQQKLQRLKYR